MSSYEIYLFLHILGAFLIAGGATLGEVVMAAARRARDTETIVTLLTMGSRVPLLTITGALLTVIFGTLLVFEVRYSFGALWINLSYIAWFAAVGLSVGILGPAEGHLHELARREAAAGGEASPELLSGLRAPKLRIVNHTLSGLVLLFLVLMVFKPGS